VDVIGMNVKDYEIIANLRSNARMPLTTMSRKTNIPVSTLFDKLRAYRKDVFQKHTTLLNFDKLGFHARANVMIRVDRDAREDVREYLSKHRNINTVFKINNGYDFMFESVFPNIKDMEDFLWLLDQKFKILNREVYYIVEDVKKECFMSEPEMVVGYPDS
jgi:DNA-binding Lrp family transcriptional regulator